MKYTSILHGFVRVGLALCLVQSAGCYRAYAPPTENEPHALIKIRRTYEKVGGVALRESLRIDDGVALTGVTAIANVSDGRTDVVLAHPRPATFEFSNGFFHQELRNVQESYTTQTPYTATESYSCGSYSNYQSCSRSTTRYRNDTHYRTVARWVEVSEGSCGQKQRFFPQNGGSYLLVYTYRDHANCSLSCFEQAPTSPTEFALRPCQMLPLEE